jgi:6-phosphofructokinase 1
VESFVTASDRVLWSSSTKDIEEFSRTGQEIPSFEAAGPRQSLFFDPQVARCGIVTCGGLCPGLNDVVRALTLALRYDYGIHSVLGFRYGYAGIPLSTPHEPILLTPEIVSNIHNAGGSILGTSRGPQDIDAMIDGLVKRDLTTLFTVGGDGTLHGAAALAQEINKRKLPINVIGIPKTIDNDLLWVEKSFGFESAVEEARRAVSAANNEATSAFNGIGIVKLMGRYSGFIAAHTTVADNDVNFCLIPEVPFSLEGETGLFKALERRLALRHHAVIVVAEGAGQDLLPPTTAADASGNKKLQNIGAHLCDAISSHFRAQRIAVTIKYIDPSYLVRGLAANAADSEMCLKLGQHAAHAALAGRTNMVVGYWNQRFTHVPIALAVNGRKQVDEMGELWHAVLETTGQPRRLHS